MGKPRPADHGEACGVRGGTVRRKQPEAGGTPHSKAETVVRVICALNGLCAVVFGTIMMAAANDAPMGLSELVPPIQTMPLPAFMTENLFWPGLALLLVNGVANLVATALFFSRPPAARRWALAAGVLLVSWCAFEMLCFPNAASIIYLIVGLAQTALAVGLVRR